MWFGGEFLVDCVRWSQYKCSDYVVELEEEEQVRICCVMWYEF